MKNKKKNQSSTLRVAVVSAILGAIVGSFLTFSLPHLWSYFTSPPSTLNTTPEELISWYEKIDHDVQAQDLAGDQYYGRWVRWPGTIMNIKDFTASKAILYFENFSASCDRDDARTLSVGVRVTILGKIGYIDDIGVELDDCKVEKIHQKITQ